jgi:NAD-dependent SIR2 family protein deacetylase
MEDENIRVVKCSDCGGKLHVTELKTYYKSINLISICDKCGKKENLSLVFKG